jgi:hypothetical protein
MLRHVVVHTKAEEAPPHIGCGCGFRTTNDKAISSARSDWADHERNALTLKYPALLCLVAGELGTRILGLRLGPAAGASGGAERSRGALF